MANTPEKPWPEVIAALQAQHVTLDRIAQHLGCSVRMVCYLKASGAEPKFSAGQRLLELYDQHCSSVAQAVQVTS